jgi:hypothetical protein
MSYEDYLIREMTTDQGEPEDEGQYEQDSECGVAGDPAAGATGAEPEKSLHGGSAHGRDNCAG